MEKRPWPGREVMTNRDKLNRLSDPSMACLIYDASHGQCERCLAEGHCGIIQMNQQKNPPGCRRQIMLWLKMREE